MNLRRAVLSSASVLVLVVAAAGCGDDEGSVFNAEVGECIAEIPTGNVSSFDEVDCDEDHEGEIFFLFEHEGDDDDFPGQDQLSEEAAGDCLGDEFEDYTGVPFEETAIQVEPIFPTEDSWSQGDRETICILSLGGDTVDESFEGNGDEYPLEDGSGDSGDETTDTTAAGGDEDFSALIDDCEGGDMHACDELWLTTPVGSDEERIGATCGGRSEELLNGGCEDEFG